ncbi:MAG TPA: hypothetical protein VJ783_06345 [Pirellulales bacterium]|nr:hypothetical protein [Pirellulales bacterium]
MSFLARLAADVLFVEASAVPSPIMTRPPSAIRCRSEGVTYCGLWFFNLSARGNSAAAVRAAVHGRAGESAISADRVAQFLPNGVLQSGRTLTRRRAASEPAPMRQKLRAFTRYCPRVLTLVVCLIVGALIALANLNRDTRSRRFDAETFFQGLNFDIRDQNDGFDAKGGGNGLVVSWNTNMDRQQRID